MTGPQLYRAAWRHYSGASGEWEPEPWAVAVTRLVDELESSLGRWAEQDDSANRAKYAAALDELRELVHEDPRPVSIELPWHWLAIER